ncbi:MAG: hypothetical protein K2G63_00455 [Oscillospiraceae bacterium]|nr:hypothetical protein [Oscillospiraceae bacterium]
MGHILRQPYAKKQAVGLLNNAYVLTCSDDFNSTLESIVKGLNSAGFSQKYYRVGTENLPIISPQETVTQHQSENFDILDTIDISEIKITPVQEKMKYYLKFNQ